MSPQLAVKNIVVCATAWAAARQKLRGLTKKVEDLADRKSTKPEDYARIKLDLEKAKNEIVKSAEKLEKAVNEFTKLKMPVAGSGKKINMRKLAGVIGTVASAFEEALATPATNGKGGWQPPTNVIDVEVVDATPKK